VKWFLRILLVLVILVVVVVLFFLGPVARPIAASAASKAMGVDVNIGGLSVYPITGSANVSGLLVANPQGFKGYFLEMEQLHSDAKVTSFVSDTAVVRDVTIEGLTLRIEASGSKTNVKAIMDNLNKSSAPSGETTSSSSGKKFRIDTLALKNTKVIISTGIVKDATITIESLELHNIGTGESSGAGLSEVLTKVIQAVVAKAGELSRNLPGEIGSAIKSAGIDKAFKDIGKTGGGAIEKAADPLKKLFK